MIIELWGCSSELGKVVPGAGWEVMVFCVVAEVEVEEVPESKIVVRFEALCEFVVLCDDVDCSWVWADRDPGSDE